MPSVSQDVLESGASQEKTMIRPIETLRVPSLQDTHQKKSLVVTVSALPIIPEGYPNSPNSTEIALYRILMKYSKFPLMCSVLLEIALWKKLIRPQRIGGVGNSMTAKAIAKTWHLPYISAGDAVKKLQEKLGYSKISRNSKFYDVLAHPQYDIKIE